MKLETFNQILAVNPLIAELCNKLGLEFDENGYRVEKATQIAYKTLGNDYVSQNEAIKQMILSEGYTEEQSKSVVKYWLYNNIVKTGVIWQGEKKNIKQEVIFIENVPQQFRVRLQKEPEENHEKSKDVLIATQILSKVNFMPKDDFILSLSYLGFSNPSETLKTWLLNNICFKGVCYLGTARQVRTEIIFLENVPF